MVAARGGAGVSAGAAKKTPKAAAMKPPKGGK
jgi:hypothetical protein